ncbi:MAG: hypothetical protein WCH84_02535 [Verrucomicrobiota bacterium]
MSNKSIKVVSAPVTSGGPKYVPTASVTSADGKISGIVWRRVAVPTIDFGPDSKVSAAMQQAVLSYVGKEIPEWAIYDKAPEDGGSQIARGYGTNVENRTSAVYRPMSTIDQPGPSGGWYKRSIESGEIYGVLQISYSNAIPGVVLQRCEFEKQVEVKRIPIDEKDVGLKGVEIKRTPLKLSNNKAFPPVVGQAATRLISDGGNTSEYALLVENVQFEGGIDPETGSIVYHRVNGNGTASSPKCLQSDGNGRLTPTDCVTCKAQETK